MKSRSSGLELYLGLESYTITRHPSFDSDLLGVLVILLFEPFQGILGTMMQLL